MLGTIELLEILTHFIILGVTFQLAITFDPPFNGEPLDSFSFNLTDSFENLGEIIMDLGRIKQLMWQKSIKSNMNKSLA